MMASVRWLCMFVLAGCFGEGALGGAVTPNAPAAPSGDGFYARGGGGVGWGNEWGVAQASADVMKLGDVTAVGGAARATVFVLSEEDDQGVGGIGLTARAFHGVGIGGSHATDELSFGFAFAALDRKERTIESADLSFTIDSTSFDDRPAMRTYGINLGIALDPETFLDALGCVTFVYCRL